MDKGPVEIVLGCAETRVAAAISGGSFLSLAPVAEPARPFLAALLARKLSQSILIVTDGLKSQEAWELSLIAFGASPQFYPAWESLPHTGLPSADVIADRLRVLKAPARIIVASVQALLQRTFSPAALRTLLLELRVGQEMEMDSLAGKLVRLGYVREAQVQERGQFAVRGGIMDLFPLDEPTPLRLEFFGDSIDSMRRFDVATQVSASRVESCVIGPAGEIGLLQQHTDWLGDLLDFLPENTLIVLDEPDRLAEAARRYAADLPEDDPFHLPFERLMSRPHVVSLSDVVTAGSVELTINSLEAYRPISAGLPEAGVAEQERKKFFAQLRMWTEQDYEVFIFCNNDGERQRLKEILPLHGLGSVPLRMEIGTLAQGFIWPDARLVVVSDAEIFGRYRILRPRKLAKRLPHETRRISDVSELDEGDFVVHIEHGIGRYRGLQEVDIGGARQEVMTVEYAEGARLYVPVAQAHLVTRYVGAGKASPPLSWLGSLAWRKSRDAAEQATRDLAAELLELQAARAALPGHAFKPDTAWQREFEAAFIYEETPDQLTSAAEIKRDMEASKPMDRLLCGDVGYGKTEVAMRAAFKTVMDGRQVAVLVPTTVLAQQHFNTFCERMADYPVRIEMLSRFRTTRQQNRILRALREGSLDIVIGTHRLLSGDVQFRDIGLVIVDEEQRFGVAHKETFKLLRKMVDVLTLTATPIPRTLYLSLMGLRDLSSLDTPPADRLPVQTTVCAYDERVIRDAIRRELARDGQVYFLHNRVHDIEKVALRIAGLVPEARVGIGHGQMHEDELESVMQRFVNGEIDVLLCTTIIESGLDIPNANTIIIDRADRFGLADLYQLRGRVGRYKHQAYAYLMLPRHGHLFDTARKRITAIRQYSSLGSGYKIAMRDLEIRGAGNILGRQQSGHITAVGFELYCQLLKESIGRLKGREVKPRVEVRTRLDFLALTASEAEDEREAWSVGRGAMDESPVKRESCFLPHDYVSDARQRIELYRKLAQAASVEEIGTLRQEMRDRFGKLPASAELLLQLAMLKLFAGNVGVTNIETRGDKIILSRDDDYVQVGGKFPRLSGQTAAAKLKDIHRVLAELRKATSQPKPAG
ncbi:MAG: transcription-repair coupling factor [Verrucomicrobia bacterium]|nr:transcription-repair coupling factor [Verrucomicrobiota bacterium]